MMIKRAFLILIIFMIGVGIPIIQAATPASPNAKADTAVFAGGCFWCEETAFEGKPGVISVLSGYAGGSKVDPTYEEVSAGSTGHAESVQVTFDPKKISYEQLLKIFWHNADPTDAEGQFCDRGNQYRSEIFYSNASQKQLAEKSKQEVMKQLHRQIVTEIVPLKTFYPAEEYHQDYYKKKPANYESYRLGCGRDRRLEELWGPPPASSH